MEDTIAERAKRLIASTGITVASYSIEVKPGGQIVIHIYGGGIIEEPPTLENTLPQTPGKSQGQTPTPPTPTAQATIGPEHARPARRKKRKTA